MEGTGWGLGMWARGGAQAGAWVGYQVGTGVRTQAEVPRAQQGGAGAPGQQRAGPTRGVRAEGPRAWAWLCPVSCSPAAPWRSERTDRARRGRCDTSPCRPRQASRRSAPGGLRGRGGRGTWDPRRAARRARGGGAPCPLGQPLLPWVSFPAGRGRARVTQWEWRCCPRRPAGCTTSEPQFPRL